MLLKIVISALLAAALLALCWRLRGVMLTPVKTGEHVRAQVVLWVDGAAPGLEQTVNGLTWLRANGTLRAEVVIVDRGMDRATADVAAALEKSGAVKIVN